ncbi:activator of Hsp90 ATPase-like protein [Mucilaginibacter yixingensis]|uniref:Activator of Hsp90 ATPase-like protein n=1 Tax=Mucilaginibacter yixingensis TaxID=1295612 RepID=A0A2T5JG30_9SPHI|nr:SRPBCC domain-containing protein [Mucilaginibacter yixingensis]PTR01387.1 activator of Hsp90 ATPase-like protein [Mucilaginibacter yixingensis]
MNNQDLQFSNTFNKPAQEVFNAVNNVRGWWGEGIEGGTDQLNDEFIYRHGDIHYSKHKLVEVVPYKKVVWLITDSQLTFTKDQSEWTGTTISFEITENGDQTQLTFTHHGLTPQVECFEACSGAWGYYMQSLASLINTGQGKPDKKELQTAHT